LNAITRNFRKDFSEGEMDPNRIAPNVILQQKSDFTNQLIEVNRFTLWKTLFEE